MQKSQQGGCVSGRCVRGSSALERRPSSALQQRSSEHQTVFVLRGAFSACSAVFVLKRKQTFSEFIFHVIGVQCSQCKKGQITFLVTVLKHLQHGHFSRQTFAASSLGKDSCFDVLGCSEDTH